MPSHVHFALVHKSTSHSRYLEVKIRTNISITTSKKIALEVKDIKEFILKSVQVSISKFCSDLT